MNNPSDSNHPTLPALCAELRELRAMLLGLGQLMNERNTRYEGMFRESKEAVASALAAAKEQTAASFVASEKAITKAEEAQKAYNVAHNDLTRKMDAQYKEMLPRPESDTRFKAIEEKLSDLRESRSAFGGGSSALMGAIVIAGILGGLVFGILRVVVH